MDKEELRMQILENFGGELEGLDLDIHVVEKESLPDDKELSKNNLFLEYIGNLGEKAVWVVKKMIGKGFKIIEIIVILTTFSIYLRDIYIPKSFEILQNIGSLIHDYKYFNIIEKTVIDQNTNSGYVIFKPSWMDNEVSYNEDTGDQNNILEENVLTEHSYALPVSGSTATIIDNLTKLNIKT